MVNKVHGSTWLSVTWVIVFTGIKNKQNTKTVTTNLWQTEEEWVTGKSAEADTTADVITWAYAWSNLTYNISGHAYILPTCEHCHQTMQDCFKTCHHCLMCSAVLWFKVSVYTHWLFNLLMNNLINHSTENKTNKMVCKYFHLPIKARLAFPQMQ